MNAPAWRRANRLLAFVELLLPALEGDVVTLPRAVAVELAGELNEHTECLIRQALAEDAAAAAEPLARAYPALDKWRRSVLESPRPRTPLERAAAWELTALECTQLGAPEEAAHAAREAHAAIASKPRVA